jgi:hypothetical protein
MSSFCCLWLCPALAEACALSYCAMECKGVLCTVNWSCACACACACFGLSLYPSVLAPVEACLIGEKAVCCVSVIQSVC